MADRHVILERARVGDLERLGEDREAVVESVVKFAQAGDAASALELVGRTWRIWSSRGEIQEGTAAAAAALGAPGADAPTVWRTRTLYADGLFAFRSGDTERSRTRNEEALRIARKSGDARGECEALTGLARVALREGRYEDVVSLAREGRERARVAQDLEAEAAPLHLHAAGVRLQQQYLAARDLYLESIELNRATGNPGWVSMEHHNLGWVEIHLGNVDEAAAHFRARDEALPADPQSAAWSLLNRAAVALAQRDLDEARRCFAEGSRALENLRVTLDPDDGFELEWLAEQLAGSC